MDAVVGGRGIGHEYCWRGCSSTIELAWINEYLVNRVFKLRRAMGKDPIRCRSAVNLSPDLRKVLDDAKAVKTTAVQLKNQGKLDLSIWNYSASQHSWTQNLKLSRVTLLLCNFPGKSSWINPIICGFQGENIRSFQASHSFENILLPLAQMKRFGTDHLTHSGLVLSTLGITLLLNYLYPSQVEALYPRNSILVVTQVLRAVPASMRYSLPCGKHHSLYVD